MPRYDKYGPQDDVTLEDLDIGFTGFNNRLRPDQLLLVCSLSVTMLG